MIPRQLLLQRPPCPRPGRHFPRKARTPLSSGGARTPSATRPPVPDGGSPSRTGGPRAPGPRCCGRTAWRQQGESGHAVPPARSLLPFPCSSLTRVPPYGGCDSPASDKVREELSSDWFLHFSGVGLFIYLFILSLSSLPLSSLVLCSNSIIPELVVRGRHQSIKLMIQLDASTNLFIYLFVTSELSLFGSLGIRPFGEEDLSALNGRDGSLKLLCRFEKGTDSFKCL